MATNRGNTKAERHPPSDQSQDWTEVKRKRGRTDTPQSYRQQQKGFNNKATRGTSQGENKAPNAQKSGQSKNGAPSSKTGKSAPPAEKAGKGNNPVQGQVQGQGQGAQGYSRGRGPYQRTRKDDDQWKIDKIRNLFPTIRTDIIVRILKSKNFDYDRTVEALRVQTQSAWINVVRGGLPAQKQSSSIVRKDVKPKVREVDNNFQSQDQQLRYHEEDPSLYDQEYVDEEDQEYTDQQEEYQEEEYYQEEYDEEAHLEQEGYSEQIDFAEPVITEPVAPKKPTHSEIKHEKLRRLEFELKAMAEKKETVISIHKELENLHRSILESLDLEKQQLIEKKERVREQLNNIDEEIKQVDVNIQKSNDEILKYQRMQQRARELIDPEQFRPKEF